MSGDLSELIELGGSLATVAAAHQTGLVDSLSRPASPEEHATRVGLHREATALVLDTLVALGIAERRDGRVSASEALAAASGSPLDDLLPMQGLWRHLPQFLKTGERYAHMDGPATQRAADYRGLVAALGDLFERAAQELAPKLPPAGGRILDIGAGSGVWGLEMCARSPLSHLTALDLPEVLPAFRDRAHRLGLTDRVHTFPGDFHCTDLGSATFDRIVLANILHLEAPEDACSLIYRAARALKPGGELIVVDCLGDGDPARQAARAVYALHLAMRTSAGRVHPRAEIERWVKAARMSHGQLITLDAPPRSLAALVHHKALSSENQ